MHGFGIRVEFVMPSKHVCRIRDGFSRKLMYTALYGVDRVDGSCPPAVICSGTPSLIIFKDGTKKLKSSIFVDWYNGALAE